MTNHYLGHYLGGKLLGNFEGPLIQMRTAMAGKMPGCQLKIWRLSRVTGTSYLDC